MQTQGVDSIEHMVPMCENRFPIDVWAFLDMTSYLRWGRQWLGALLPLGGTTCLPTTGHYRYGFADIKDFIILKIFIRWFWPQVNKFNKISCESVISV